MRIAVLHSFYDSRTPSGENTVVREQVGILRDAGHEVRLISRDTAQVARRRGYAVQAAVTTATGVGPEPQGELEVFGPDIVHCHNLFPNWGTRWLDTFGGRTVVTLHNYRTLCAAATMHRDGAECALCPSRSAVHAIIHRCYRGSAAASLPLAVASRGAGRHAALLRKPAARVVLNRDAAGVFRRYHPTLDVTVIPNAVTAHPGPMHGTPGGWLYAGRLTAEKGVGFLRQHWPRGERLQIAGDGPLRSAVQTMAEQEPETFTFVGALPREQLRELIGRSEGLVLPSLWSEGLPTVVIESLAAGTPALVSERCGAMADLRAGGGAVTFDPDRGELALTAALHIVRDGGNRARSGARAAYETQFAPQVWLNRMTELFESVLERAS